MMMRAAFKIWTAVAATLLLACGSQTPASSDAPAGAPIDRPVESITDAAVSFPGQNRESWPWPDPRTLPEGPLRDQILRGEALVDSTAALIGPVATDPAMRFAGNNLDCGSCHLDAGRRRYGLSYIGAAAAYPRHMAREDSVRTLADRINGCMERSMNGRALPEDSPELAAMIAYIDFLSDFAPDVVEGRGAPSLPLPDRAADPIRGRNVYAAHCASCHGEDGAGVAAAETHGYLYPPLWGPDSFNDGAGMHRIIKAATFIRANMPFGASFDSPVLSIDEAFDVAAYINVQTRPHMKGLDRDYPDRSKKPPDAPFPPYADDYPAAQHKFGPWKPIIAAQGRE